MPNDITPVESSDLISQFPTQFREIVLQLLNHCASNAFPAADNQPGRLAYMLEDGSTPATFTDGGPMRGCVFGFKGTQPNGDPIWVRLLNINDVPATASQLAAVNGAKQATLTGAATSIASSNLTASRALVSDANGKVGVSAVTAAEVSHLAGVTSSVQAQLNGKQPLILSSTAAPTPADATGKPDGTIWVQFQ